MQTIKTGDRINSYKVRNIVQDSWQQREILLQTARIQSRTKVLGYYYLARFGGLWAITRGKRGNGKSRATFQVVKCRRRGVHIQARLIFIPKCVLTKVDDQLINFTAEDIQLLRETHYQLV